MTPELLHARCLGHGDAEALRLSGRRLSLSYGGLAAAVAGLAALLGRNGIGRGARIALAVPPSLDFAVGLLAAARCGAAAAPLDISLRGMSLEDALAALTPDAVIATAGILPRLAGGGPARVVVAFEPADGPVAAGTLRHGGGSEAFRLVAEPGPESLDGARGAEGSRPEDDVLLVATSGSTGRPKFVRLGHRGTLANIAGHLESFGLDRPFRALQVLGTSYSYGLIPSFLAPLATGGTVVLPPHGDPRAIRAAIAQDGPTVCLTTPALLEYLVDTCPPDERGALARLETIGIGGDAAREPLRRKLAGALPGTRLFATYGATEAGPRIATLPPERFLARPHAAGLPLPGVELAVVDDDGKPVPPGVAGRLRVRTPSRMNGYLGEPGPVGEWLSIGDRASLDTEGCLTIHGRADRAFKHRGRLIDPAQIESVIARFPGVLATQVEPAPAGDRLSAVVHFRPDHADPSLADRLRRYCRRNLPNRLVPHEITVVAEGDGYFFKGRRLHFETLHP